MAAEGHANIKVNGSVRLVGDVPTSRGAARTTTSVPPEMSTTFIETTTTLSTTTTRKQRSPPTIQVQQQFTWRDTKEAVCMSVCDVKSQRARLWVCLLGELLCDTTLSLKLNSWNVLKRSKQVLYKYTQRECSNKKAVFYVFLELSVGGL